MTKEFGFVLSVKSADRRFAHLLIVLSWFDWSLCSAVKTHAFASDGLVWSNTPIATAAFFPLIFADVHNQWNEVMKVIDYWRWSIVKMFGSSAFHSNYNLVLIWPQIEKENYSHSYFWSIFPSIHFHTLSWLGHRSNDFKRAIQTCLSTGTCSTKFFGIPRHS